MNFNAIKVEFQIIFGFRDLDIENHPKFCDGKRS
jgi:hypothetical protein